MLNANTNYASEKAEYLWATIQKIWFLNHWLMNHMICEDVKSDFSI